MSHTMPVARAAATLSELVASPGPDEEIVLTEGGQPVARIVSHPARPRRRQPGNCKGMLTIRSDDEGHLDDFGNYMP